MKYYHYLLFSILGFLLLCGCRTTQGTENRTVKLAIARQQEVINDPLFKKILLELEASEKVDWQEGSTANIEEDLSQYESKTHWALAKFESEGPYPERSVLLWRKWNPFSSTTAATYNCGIENKSGKTRLNKWRLCRDHYSITNTLIHERLHSFCFIHPKTQTRPGNECDIAYLSGDLAEVILLYRQGIKERKMDQPICEALREKIEEYELLTLIE